MRDLAIGLRNQYIAEWSQNEQPESILGEGTSGDGSISGEDMSVDESLASQQDPSEDAQSSGVNENTDGMNVSETAWQPNPVHESIGALSLEGRTERDARCERDDEEINEMEKQMNAIWEDDGKKNQQR